MGAMEKQGKPGRSEGTLPFEFSKLRASEIAGSVYFSTYCCIFKVFKEGNQVTRKKLVFEKCKEGHVSQVPTSMTWKITKLMEIEEIMLCTWYCLRVKQFR